MCILYSASIAVGVASAGAADTGYCCGRVGRDGYNNQHSADYGDYTESDADASQSLLRGSLGCHGSISQDDGRYGAGKADDGGTKEQHDQGEYEGTSGQTLSLFLGCRHSGCSCCWLSPHYDSGGVGNDRLWLVVEGRRGVDMG